MILWVWNNSGDLFRIFNLFEFQEGWISKSSLADEFDRFSFGLGFNNNTFFNISGLFDIIFSSFSFLLSDLFSFNSFKIFLSKGKFSNRYVINNNSKLLSSLLQNISDLTGNLISVTQQLWSSVLSNNNSHNLISNRG